MDDAAAWADPEQERFSILAVKEDGDGYEIKRSDGWLLWMEKGSTVPAVGDALICWGSGVGYGVRGIAINGRIVRYHTAQEEAEKHGARLYDVFSGHRLWVRRHDDYVSIAISYTPKHGPTSPFQHLSFTPRQWEAMFATPEVP
jgi:hypothetical protein